MEVGGEGSTTLISFPHLLCSYADAHGNMAGVLLQQQKFDEAAKHYTRALQLNEHNACWLVDLGHIYRVKNKRVDAKMCFIKATNVNPHFAIAFSNLACIYKDEGTCTCVAASCS